MVLKELLEDILVQGTKITHRMLPPDLSAPKNVENQYIGGRFNFVKTLLVEAFTLFPCLTATN